MSPNTALSFIKILRPTFEPGKIKNWNATTERKTKQYLIFSI
jgi:hypothetical protein